LTTVPAARAAPRDTTLPVPTARGLAFFALAAFGVLHWMALLDPPTPNRALYALGAGIVAVGGMLAAARLPFRAGQLAAVVVLVVVLALALLGGGVADELAAARPRGRALVGHRPRYRGASRVCSCRTAVSTSGRAR